MIRQRYAIFQACRPRVQVDCFHAVLDERGRVTHQLFTIRSDVPRFNLTAQVLIKQRLEEEVVVVVDERDITCAIEVERSEQAAKTTANDQDMGTLFHEDGSEREWLKLFQGRAANLSRLPASADSKREPKLG